MAAPRQSATSTERRDQSGIIAIGLLALLGSAVAIAVFTGKKAGATPAQLSAVGDPSIT